ncbi:MAG: hypothetical protein EHM23_09605 [Acidobacteria bacterium]|nr:MAG: hypothetical protein EHM23_09605 [Acidobacteriota bacterium]
MAMRWRLLALIQLLVLTAHLCASPFSSLYLEKPLAEGRTTFKMLSAPRDTLPFAIEEKVRVKACSLGFEAETGLGEPPAPPPRAVDFVFGIPKAPPLLNGFLLRVCQRPPPSCL